MVPVIIKGGFFEDDRGSLKFNNNFDTSSIKRLYIIQNKNCEIIRGWQGHKVEQRWFTALVGDFVIRVIKINNWNNPAKNSDILTFELNSSQLDVLHVPFGYVTSIQSKSRENKLLVMSDHKLNQIEDEYRFSSDWFS